MKKHLLAVIFLLSLSTALWAQEEGEEPKKGFQKEKLFVGGNFGLTFGDYTLINVSPQLGYRFTNLFAAGLGINGQYVSYRQRDWNGNSIYKSTLGVVGLNVFGRVYPIPQAMLQVQPEANYIFGKDIYYTGNPTGEFKRDAMIVPSLLMGGGAVLPSGRGAFIISIMYDVLQRENSPYCRKPNYNICFNVGL
jgi:hypothetical protein